MSFDHIAQPWTSSTSNTANRLRIKSNNMFFFAHHPRNWSCVKMQHGKKEKWVWLPKLNKIPEKPGVNLVRGEQGAVDSTLAQTSFMKKGFTILYPSKHDYMRIYPAVRGKYHTTKFVKLEQLAGEIIKTNDTAAFNTWLQSLVAAGHIELPHPHIMKKIMSIQRELINMHANKQYLPLAKEEMTLAEELLQGMQEATASVQKDGKKYYE